MAPPGLKTPIPPANPDGNSRDTLNEVLHRAGVEPSQLSILSCSPEAICKIHIQNNGQREERDIPVDQFFAFANERLAKFPGMAKNRQGNLAKPFLRSDTEIWFDVDRVEGGDGVLVRHDGKILFGKIPPPISGTKNWQELGLLSISPEKFREFLKKYYAFEWKGGDSPWMNPLHAVALAGHPDKVVPWSDPYLLYVYESFLKSLPSVEVEEEAFFSTYSLNNIPFLRIVRDEDGTSFSFLSPTGVVYEILDFSNPPRPEAKVIWPKPGQSLHVLDIHGKKLSVEAHWPKDVDRETQKRKLSRVGYGLGVLPRHLLGPILDGRGEEKPLSILLTDKAKAREMGVLGEKEYHPGHYNFHENRCWIDIASLFERAVGETDETLYHEIMGHAWDDANTPFDNDTGITFSENSPLRDYYAWKLTQLFRPQELAEYDRLSSRYRKLVTRDREHRTPEETTEISELQVLLEPFRKKASEIFVSTYAVEGSRGVGEQLKRPVEDFAELMTALMSAFHLDWSALQGGRRQYGLNDPALVLMGTDYLFQEYGVAKLGQIKREEVYSQKAFREVLGIDLTRKSNLEAYRDAGIPLDGDFRPGWSVPLVVGGKFVHWRTKGEDRNSLGSNLGFRFGFQGKEWGGGVLLEGFFAPEEPWRNHPIHSFQSGLWMRRNHDVTPVNSGFGSGLSLYLEPSLGYAHTMSKENDNSGWVGLGGGLGIWGGTLSLGLQGQFGISDAGQWKSLGLNLQFDPPRFARQWPQR